MRHQYESWAQLGRQIPFQNKSGEVIPAYAVMQVNSWNDTVDGSVVIEVVKPDTNGITYMINGPVDVADDGYGTGAHEWPAVGLATHTGDVGPEDGLWSMTDQGQGYRVPGALKSGRGVIFKRCI